MTSLEHPINKLRARERHHRALSDMDAEYALVADDLDERDRALASSKEHEDIAEQYVTGLDILERQSRMRTVPTARISGFSMVYEDGEVYYVNKAGEKTGLVDSSVFSKRYQ